jgi:hypothetical protein
MNLDEIIRETKEAQRQLNARYVAPTQPPQPHKHKVLEDMLVSMPNKGVLQVKVDCTLPGVKVPDPFVGHPELVLNFSPRYDNPHDLLVDDDAIRQTLSFSGQRQLVHVPLRAVTAARCVVSNDPSQLPDFHVFPQEDLEPLPPESA